MSKVFYLNEIIKFAVEKEIESYNLYHALAKHYSNDVRLKTLFETLRDEEVKHKDFYQNMLKTVEAEQKSNLKEDEEYFAYLEEFIAQARKVAPFPQEKMDSLAEAFHYAILREKDSILFYSMLRNYVSASVRDQITMIISEEVKHLAKLNQAKGAL
jgi:rubrerythrin